MTAKRSPARRAALYGLLVAAAFIFGYLESLLPSVGVPGIKLGLANLVTVAALYRLRAAGADPGKVSELRRPAAHRRAPRPGGAI